MSSKEYKIKNLTPDKIQGIRDNQKLFNIFLGSNPGFIEDIILKFITHDHADYEDFYQTGCVSLWKALEKFNVERKNASSFSTFAYTVILNDILQEVNKANSRKKSEVPIEALRAMYDGELSSDYNEKLFEETAQTYMCRNFEDIVINKMVVQDKLQGFSDIERKVFQFKFVEKLSLRETAKKIGMNQHTLKQLFYKKIYSKIKDVGYEIMANAQI